MSVIFLIFDGAKVAPFSHVQNPVCGVFSVPQKWYIGQCSLSGTTLSNVCNYY